MAFRFSLRVTIACLVLAALFVRLSVWQWSRYLEKLEVIRVLDQNIDQPPAPIADLITTSSVMPWSTIFHRRVSVAGTYDYDHEVILRNRRYKGFSGAHVITPMKLDNTETWILVNRGFIPLENSSQDSRKIYRKEARGSFTGLVKESMRQKIFSPSDPESGKNLPWVDAWLRIDVPKIAKQLPYEILPVYLETMNTSDARAAVEEVVAADSSGKDELLNLSGRGGLTQNFGMNAPDLDYPVPIFNTIIPPGRHLGYVYEWATMAIAVILIGLVLQMRRPRATGPLAG